MPELPEVETVRAGLAPVMEGQVIARVQVNRPDLRWPLPPDLSARLTGARVLALRRRSKYILADLDSGDSLIVHLGMSGRMLVSGHGVGQFHHEPRTPEKHDHVVIDMAGGVRITFNDARRFGAIDLCATARLPGHHLLVALGPEPLGNAFHAAYLAGALAGRKMPLKPALLDQRIIAGLGNIYVSESLWRARLHPCTPAGQVPQASLPGLVAAIRDVLQEAIAAGGSTLRDYRQSDGELGYFQHAFAVYDRAGQPCLAPGCAGRIDRVVQQGRSGYHCPLCQPAPGKA